jgi:thiol-disulfide isomerase/thioredoxin
VNEDLRRRAATSLVGKPAPELDGMTWLNTEKSSMCLADFRGKYVLLDFWTTWCGPCHADFPTVKLVDQLYRDKGLVVVGVHDNSMPLDAIRADAAKEGLTFAIVADHPDGRLLRSYDVSSWPSYVLIGPDGTVVRDFKLPGPTLRTRKLEIIRELVMGEQPAPR